MTVLALSLVMSSCVKDKMFVGDPSISSIAINPTSVDPGATVTVSATVYDLNGISSAVLTYTLNGAAGGSVNMTSSGDTYSAVIPGQVLKTVVREDGEESLDLDEEATAKEFSEHVCS